MLPAQGPTAGKGPMTMFTEVAKKAVVLLSGGMDSATVLAIAKAEGYDLFAMSFDYGQRHLIELESAKRIATALEIKKHIIVSFDLREIGGSALTSEMEVPKDSNQKSVVSSQNKEEQRIQKSGIGDQGSGVGILSTEPVPGPRPLIPVTYVPARNTIFLSFALGWAEVLGVESIFIGANAVDYSGYPDCRPEYLKAFEDMANLATKASVEGALRFSIKAPLIDMKKSEIIKKGFELGLDYSLTWSCYDPQPLPAGDQSSESKVQRVKQLGTQGPGLGTIFVPCGLCDSCRLREKGFREAGVEDPLVTATI